MTIVVDASVALKWILPEDGSDLADALLSQDIIAPSFWLTEAANALWRNVQMKKLKSQEASFLLQELLNAPVVSVSTHDELPHALVLANELAHPVYDCVYLALALRENIDVVTADRHFAALASRRADLRDRIRMLI